jgi:hypothetical protein
MAYDPERGCIVMYGGSAFDGETTTRHDDGWAWDGRQWSAIR